MNRMGGFSLVELLVSVLILSIGLVGLAGLQIAGVKSNQTAYHRSVATQLAYDMADRMRANPVGVTHGDYNKGTAGSNPSQCETASCTPDVLAGYDLKRWNDDLAARLPSGIGIVCFDSTPEIGDSATPSASCDGLLTVYAIKVWWDDDRSGHTTQGFVTSLQLGN